jgi:hypothetical protein
MSARVPVGSPAGDPGCGVARVCGESASAAAAARPALPRGGMCVGRKNDRSTEVEGVRGSRPQAKRSDVWGGNENFRPVRRADTAKKGRNAPIHAAEVT